MYLGHIVELASSDRVYGTPLHPYTRALLEAIPVPVPTKKRVNAPRRLGEDVLSLSRPDTDAFSSHAVRYDCPSVAWTPLPCGRGVGTLGHVPSSIKGLPHRPAKMTCYFFVVMDCKL